VCLWLAVLACLVALAVGVAACAGVLEVRAGGVERAAVTVLGPCRRREERAVSSRQQPVSKDTSCKSMLSASHHAGTSYEHLKGCVHTLEWML
jgi:hypothetical protein